MAFVTGKVEINYGLGGPHNDMGTYRVNPVTGDRDFRPWRGLGTWNSSGKTVHHVTQTYCTECGESYNALADGRDICLYCEEIKAWQATKA